MIRRLLITGALGIIAAMLLPAPAQAHPLGNFTTNQYSGIRVGPSGIDIDYVLDLAELPAYQTTGNEIDADHDGVPSATERADYAARTCAAAASAGEVTVDEHPRVLTGKPVELTFPAGSGGLHTLRLQCLLHADARIAARSTIGYRSDLYDARIGWREITAVGDRCTIVESDVPTTTISGRLTAYPSPAATSDRRSATLTVLPGGPALTPHTAAGPGAPPGATDRITAMFTDFVGRPQLTLGVGVLAIFIALILGGAHALAPGHGKTIMAAYLVSARGRLGHALTVAATVAATHTVGVLTLGVLLATSLHLAPAALYEWLRMASGVLVALVGIHLLHRAIRASRGRARAGHRHAPQARDHQHDSLARETAVAGHGTHRHAHGTHDHAHTHAHTHDHDHSHGHAHDHGHARAEAFEHSHGGRTHTHYLPAPDEPLRMRTLLTMGFAGGLSPSPTAVVVLLGAAALGRAWYGVLLVLAYGVGLAAALIGIGFALARWGERLRHLGSSRWRGLLLRRMPAATAATILAVGVGMVLMAAVRLTAAGH